MILKLQIFFYRKKGSLSAKLATIKKYIENIFTLIEKNTFIKVGNFEAKKIFQRAKVFSFEMSGKNYLKKLDLKNVISRN